MKLEDKGEAEPALVCVKTRKFPRRAARDVWCLEMTGSQFNVLRRLGGHGGQGVYCSVTCVPQGFLGTNHLHQEDVKSHKMLEGGRHGQDVSNISGP